MPIKKRPEGAEWKQLVNDWAAVTHAGKVAIAQDYGVSYDTVKHWISNAGAGQSKQAPVPELPNNNEAVQLHTTPGVTRAVILGDTHHPYQSNAALAVVEQFLEEYHPQYVFYNGDINDFYQVSVFSKDPTRLGRLQEDIDESYNMLARHRQMLPDAKMFFIAGTHEIRWLKYLQDKAPAVSMLRGATIPELFQLPSLKIEYVPFEQGILVNGTFIILHGDFASKHSSTTARQQYEKNGGCGICNHTHRMGSYFKRNRFGTFGWWENGCLCSLNPDWIKSPDWQQGFSVVHFEENGRFLVEQIPILDDRCIYGGKVIVGGSNGNLSRYY